MVSGVGEGRALGHGPESGRAGGGFDETLLNDEDRLREVYQRLEAKGAGAGGGPVRHH